VNLYGEMMELMAKVIDVELEGGFITGTESYLIVKSQVVIHLPNEVNIGKSVCDSFQ
jgi:hypothetical protein